MIEVIIDCPLIQCTYNYESKCCLKVCALSTGKKKQYEDELYGNDTTMGDIGCANLGID